MKHGFAVALDWLLPPRCAGCGQLGAVWCALCAGRAVRIEGSSCPICGLPLGKERQCGACSANQYQFVSARSWAAYRGELRHAILSMKHRRNAALGVAFAKHLMEAFCGQAWQIDLVIPIPLGARRHRERGFNQAELLARPFAEAAGLQLAAGVLVRLHETLPQFELSASERWKNLHGSFLADPAPLKGKSVLLVDDIMTTGATLDSAAQALNKAGARSVYALTLARALFEGEP
ncbi:MAG: ComF family protein [Anaerolineales bacterium]